MLGAGWGNLDLAVDGHALMLALARFLHSRQIFLRVWRAWDLPLTRLRS